MKSYFRQFAISAFFVALLFYLSLLSVSDGKSLNTATYSSVSADTSPTLILDAGHGGADGGAVSVTGTSESTINLEITLKTDNLAGFLGTKAILTRDSEDIDYPSDATTIRAKKVADQKARVALINGVDNAVLISIHQNKYTNEKPFGPQVFYSDDYNNMSSQLQTSLCSVLQIEGERTPKQIADNIYLFKNTSCPSILVECGFISNYDDAQKLETEEYQKKIAMTIIGEYFTSYMS